MSRDGRKGADKRKERRKRRRQEEVMKRRGGEGKLISEGGRDGRSDGKRWKSREVKEGETREGCEENEDIFTNTVMLSFYLVDRFTLLCFINFYPLKTLVEKR